MAKTKKSYKFKLHHLLVIVLLITVLAIGIYLSKPSQLTPVIKNDSSANSGLSVASPVSDPTLKGTTSVDDNDPSKLVYKNEKIGFEFKYPKEYGNVIAKEWYGTEGKKGRGIWFYFSSLESDNKGIQIAILNNDFGGIGIDSNTPDTGEYIKNNNGTVSFYRYDKSYEFPYEDISGSNISGVKISQEKIESSENSMGASPYTRIVYNLNNPEFQSINFLVNSELNSEATKELVSIAKSFMVTK